MKTLPIILLLTVLLLSACKKEKNLPDPPIQYMPQELKDYMLFKKNSYWVYQDSASGVLDSVVVMADTTYIQKDVDKFSNEVLSVFEAFYINTYSYLSVLHYYYRLALRCEYQIISPFDLCYFIGRGIEHDPSHNDQGHHTTCFLYYPIVGEKISSLGGYVSVGAKFDSAQVANNYYHSVVRIDDTANGTEGGWPTRFYIARHYGIIRKEILRPTGRQVWNLVRSELLQ